MIGLEPYACRYTSNCVTTSFSASVTPAYGHTVSVSHDTLMTSSFWREKYKPSPWSQSVLLVEQTYRAETRKMQKVNDECVYVRVQYDVHLSLANRTQH